MTAASGDPQPGVRSPESRDVLDTTEAGPAAIRGGALRVAGYGAGVLLSVVSAALLFRHLGVDDGGRYVTIAALVTLAGGLTDVGLTTIGVREVALRPPNERRSLLRSLLGLRLVLTTLGVVGATIFAAVAGYGATLVAGAVIAGAALILQAVQQALAVGPMAEMRLGLVAGVDLLRQVVNVACVLVLVAVDASLLSFFFVNVPANIAALVVMAWTVRGSTSLVPSIHVAEWLRLMRDMVAYAAAAAVGAVYFRIAIVLVSLIATATQTGYFGAAFRAIEVLVVLPQLLVGAAFPIMARAARDDQQRLHYSVGKVVDVCLILGVGSALLLGVGAPFVIAAVAGPEFAPAADVLRIQGIAVGLAFLAAGPSYGLLGMRRHGTVLIANLAALVVSVTLVAILTPTDGARGAAIATTVAEVVLTSLVFIGAVRAGLKLDAAVDAVPRVVVAGALALVAGLVLPAPSAIQATVAGVVYVAGLAAVRAIPQELLEMLPRRGPPTSERT